MTAWEAYPDQIRANLDAFTDVSGVNVELSLIPNVGYVSALQTRILGGEQPDVFYTLRLHVDQVRRPGLGGRAQRVRGRRGHDRRHVPVLAWLLPARGRPHHQRPVLLAIYSLFYNRELVAQAGGSGEPQTKQEIYDLSEKLKASGVAAPYGAYWTKQFCEEYLINYLLADGITPFDAKRRPGLRGRPEDQGGVLEWWAAMYQDGLTSQDILTADPGVHVTAMAQGQSAFFELHHYFLKEIRVAEGPQSANVGHRLPQPGRGSSQSLQIGEVVQMGGGLEGERATDAWELLKAYGWKDSAGVYSTFISWAQAAALLASVPRPVRGRGVPVGIPGVLRHGPARDGVRRQQRRRVRTGGALVRDVPDRCGRPHPGDADR